MNIYNSFSKSLEKFEPGENEVIMYVCGLTPYDRAHIGHARTYIAFDMVKRYLLAKGKKVLHLQNITDVDDKIIKRCKETGADPKKLTSENHDEALRLFDQLNILRADVYPKVTEHIPEIIAIIEKIIKNGFAYETKTGIYFDVSKFKGYGTLSGQKNDEIMAGSRKSGDFRETWQQPSGSRKEVDETKDDPADFALWKKTSGELIEFDSPWGRGRPGWHIECSAMSKKYAKRTIDIHGGARDLIFPHHENEIAQSEAATGEKFVKYWMHTGFLTVNGEKMSKSLGNFTTVAEVLAKHEPNAIRMFFALTHYRSPIDYNEEQIEAAGEGSERLFNSLGLMKEQLEEPKKNEENVEFRKKTNASMETIDLALEDDFDTPTAIAALFDLIRVTNGHLAKKKLDRVQLTEVSEKTKYVLGILGLEEKKSTVETKNEGLEGLLVAMGNSAEGKTTNEILDELVKLRDEFRKSRDYKKSDKIRDELTKIGILLEDNGGKTRWKVK